jgi:hypothetical protein
VGRRGGKSGSQAGENRIHTHHPDGTIHPADVANQTGQSTRIIGKGCRVRIEQVTGSGNGFGADRPTRRLPYFGPPVDAATVLRVAQVLLALGVLQQGRMRELITPAGLRPDLL